MRTPEYFDPTHLDEALGLLAQYGDEAKVVAGGQSLMVMLRQGLIEPAVLIDLGRIAPLRDVDRHDGVLRLGAMTTIRTIEMDPAIRAQFPTLAQAAGAVGPMQIRNMGTVGGNVSHNGLGADLPPALLALEARALIAGPSGTREVSLDEFFTGYFETCVAPDEIVTAFSVPTPPRASSGAYLKFSSRAVDTSIVGIAVVLEREDATVRDVRIAIGGVGPVPFRARRAEASLRGVVWSERALGEAGEIAAQEAAPMSDVHASAGYRKWLVRVLVPRALTAASAGARSNG